MPYSEYKTQYQKIIEDHPKARHIIYAYRFINEFDQIVENQTDDGEPKNSAGKPSLDVLRGNELVNTALITVRYFGGIKLGIGGMIRAYGGAIKEVITESELISYEKMFKFKNEIFFSDIAKFEHTLKEFLYIKVEKEFTETGAIFSIQAPKEIMTQIKSKLNPS